MGAASAGAAVSVGAPGDIIPRTMKASRMAATAAAARMAIRTAPMNFPIRSH